MDEEKERYESFSEQRKRTKILVYVLVAIITVSCITILVMVTHLLGG